MKDENIIKYKDYEIIPWSNGFAISPGTLNTIASFIVKNDTVTAGFAFAVGMLERMANSHLKDDDLLSEAIDIIKRKIDNNQLKHLEEYTFEHHPSLFIEVNNPKWWIKSS